MIFKNAYSDHVYSFSELKKQLVSETGPDHNFFSAFLVFMMDTLNGRNDVIISGLTSDEIYKIIVRLRNISHKKTMEVKK